VNVPDEERSPMAVALEWVSQITAIGLEIVGCIWFGRFLDDKLGTSVWGLIGLFVGPLLGFWHLMLLTGVVGKKYKNSDRDESHKQ
jgi:F0F1-type ATP synthase assembly protein I